MKILGNPKRRLTRKQMQRAIDKEVADFEQQLRDKGEKFSIPVSGKNTRGKIFNIGDNK